MSNKKSKIMGFLLPRFGKFCYCLPLKVGSLIIGYISMVISTLLLAGTSFSVYKVATFVEEHKNVTDSEHSPEQLQGIALILYMAHAYLLSILLYYLTISIMLIIGVHANKISLLKYYCYSGIILFLLALASVVISTAFFHMIATIALLKWCVAIFYSLLLVRSTYLEIEDQTKPREFEMQHLYNPIRPPSNMYY